MKVYVLFHADLEDDRYLRGVYLRREDAEADVGADEFWGPEWQYRRRHHAYCCEVDELEVLEAATARLHGPFRDELRDPSATGLIRMDLAPMIEQMATARFPAWEKLMREGK